MPHFVTLGPKDPNDIAPFSADFSDLLAGGEVISSFTSDSLSPLAMTSFSATSTGASFDVSGGAAGHDYVFNLTASTDHGHTYSRSCLMQVRDL